MAYVIVPPTLPIYMALTTVTGKGEHSLLDGFGIAVLYSVFCFAGMVVLGAPLLYLYKRLNWTGFFAFMAGGAFCAAVTYTFTGSLPRQSEFAFFTMWGVAEGLLLRLILFGIRLRPRGTAEFETVPQPSSAQSPARRLTHNLVPVLSAIWVAGLAVIAVAFFQEHSVHIKKEMTWECAPDQYRAWAPQAQPVRLRFVEDPRYEEVVSGEGLCDELKASGKKVVTVVFEAHGNRLHGLHGFRETFIDGKPIVDVGGWGSSGFTESSGSGTPTIRHPLDKAFR